MVYPHHARTDFPAANAKTAASKTKPVMDATHGDGHAIREHCEEYGGDHAAAVLEHTDECRRRTRDLIRSFGERRRVY